MAEITIVTPVLNQASTIEACIQSVANQNIEVEHIIIDGGSTDGTVEIIQQNEHLLSFWTSEKDNGQSEAINKGLEKATGTFFNWLNGDDVIVENALSVVLNAANPGSLVVAGRCKHVNLNGEELAMGSAKIWGSLEATLGNYSMAQPSVFYQTEIVKNLGGLNENLHYCMDMELWFRYLLKHGQTQIEAIDNVLSHFLIQEGSKSSKHAVEMQKEKYQIYRSVLSAFNLPPILQHFFEDYPIISSVDLRPSIKFDNQLLLAHFSWHLLVKAYEEKKAKRCANLFDIIKNTRRLSASERLMWQARISKTEFLT